MVKQIDKVKKREARTKEIQTKMLEKTRKQEVKVNKNRGK